MQRVYIVEYGVGNCGRLSTRLGVIVSSNLTMLIIQRS